MRTPSILAGLLAMVATSGFAAEEFDYPFVTTRSSVSQPVIHRGQEVRVSVEAEGQSIEQPVPVPRQIVFILDRSGSMSREGRMAALKGAATAVIDTFDPKFDELAIVAFSSDASIPLNFSSDFGKARSVVGGLSPDGLTNYARALEDGISVLRQASTPIRYAIFFSDGLPQPPGQDKRIQQLLDQFEPQQVPIYSVGLGTADFFALRVISSATGGEHFSAKSTDRLAAIFRRIADSNAKLLTTRQVRFSDTVPPKLTPIAGSFKHSVLPRGPEDRLPQKLNAAGARFTSTGVLELPPIPQLGEKSEFTYSYDLTATDCDAWQDQVESVHSPSAFVAYRNGMPKEITQAIGTTEVTIRKCGLAANKRLLRTNNILLIDLVNFGETVVWDVHIEEKLLPPIVLGDHRFISPPATRVDSEGVEWHVGEIKGNQSTELKLQIAPNSPDTNGRHKIQQVESRAFYSAFGDIHFVRQNARDYRAILANLDASSTSPAVATVPAMDATLASAFWPGHASGTGTISPTSGTFQENGFDYRIDYGQPPRDEMGVVFAKIEQDRVLFRQAERRIEQIQQVFTPPHWNR